jgi:hypothetical protein
MAEGTPPDHEQRLRDSLAARNRIKAHLGDYWVIEGERFPDASNEYSNAYIRIEDVERAWSGEGIIERALYPNILQPVDMTSIREKLLLFLSVLVWLDAHTHLNRFRSYTFRDDGSLLCANDQMPLQRQEIPDFGDETLQKRFYHEQFMFSPVSTVDVRYRMVQLSDHG